MLADLVGRGADGDAAADQAAHLVRVAELVEREVEDRGDLGRLHGELEAGLDEADERVDLIAGHEGADRRQGAGDIDDARLEGDLLLGLAERRGEEAVIAFVVTPPGERDLAGVAAQVGAALGEDEAWIVGPAVEGQEDGGVGLAVGVEDRGRFGRQQGAAQLVAQMITCTVPPSTDQAAPAT